MNDGADTGESTTAGRAEDAAAEAAAERVEPQAEELAVVVW